MKKRVLSLLLAAVLLLGVIPVSTQAAQHAYGTFPILNGYADVDYMADQILSEIPLKGKDARGQIQAVYDWIITHCDRDSWDGTYYFDETQVAARAEAYAQEKNELIRSGDALIRPELAAYLAPDSGAGSYDSNYLLASYAYSMMLTRTGNCVHYSALLAVLLGHLGFDCRLIPGEFINNNGTVVEHKWNYVLVDGQYYWLDVRMDHATYVRTGKVPHDYFMVADTNKWAKKHNWDHTYSDLLAANAADIAAMYEEAAHAHVLNQVAQSSAACTTDGCVAHYVCSVCGGYFLDAEGTRQVDAEDVVIPALGHDWEAWVTIEESTHDAAGTRQHVCRRDPGHVETEKTRALGNPYDDVKAGEYYETPVVWAVDNSITSGMTPDTFVPNGNCTRAQVVTFLYRVAGEPDVTGVANPFGDVAEGQWYTDAVLWAVSKGITSGMTATTFEPDGNCTRAQVVTFLYRAAGQPDVTDVRNPFTDVTLGTWYSDCVLWAVDNGITSGMTPDTFAPDGTCTRAQVVTFLYRARDLENSAE